MRRVATAVALDAVGSAAVLVLLSLTWLRVRIDRDPPFADVAVGLAGRGVAPAAFGLALVTLAGAVAALATRGLARRLVGVVVVAAGVGVAVAALTALGDPGDDRARTLATAAVADRTAAGATVPIHDGAVAVAVQGAWPVLAAVGAALTVAAGVLWLLPVAGGRPGEQGGTGQGPPGQGRPGQGRPGQGRPGQGPPGRGTGRGRLEQGGLGPRYEAPVAAGPPRDATLWSALDHGEDPTAEAVDPTATGVEPDPHTARDGAAG